MEYEAALLVAQKYLEMLRPHCERIAIAGSIRRREAWCNDIEIVCIPKPYDTGLFASGIALVAGQWPKIKGEFPCKYTQRMLPEGIKLDLFTAEPGNWGVIYAIRTGPADYSHEVLATGWVKKGYKGDGGYLIKNGKARGFREEQELFDFLGLKYVPAFERRV